VLTLQSHFAHIDNTIWAVGAVDMSKCPRELAQMCRRKAILCLLSKAILPISTTRFGHSVRST
jgi:hypothetical protein